MIKKQKVKSGTVKVTFSVQDDGEPVSVVGEFNGWDPLVHPLKKRTNGTRSVSIELAPGERYQFRYLSTGGRFFNDDSADSFASNDRGEEHCIVIV